MSNSAIIFDRVISVAILVALVAVLFRGCIKDKGTTPPEQMDQQEIKRIIQQNFDTLQRAQIEIISSSVAELKQLATKDNDLSEAERSILRRLVQLSTDMKQQGNELKNYIELNTVTKHDSREIVYIRDSSGNQMPVPDYIKRLPLVIESAYTDDYSNVRISYDVQSDSIATELLIYNRFKLSQSVNEAGKPIAIVTNDNPYTLTEPGTSVFDLDIPEATKERLWGIGITAGVVMDKDLRPAPGVAAGLQYNIGKALFRRWKK